MSVEITIKVPEMAKLMRKFETLPRKVVSALSEAIEESAFLIERGSKIAITTGDTRAIKTGRLRSDIIVRELTPLRAAIYPIVHYAIYVHEGTKHMAPRPFMKRGAEMVNSEVRGTFRDKIRAALE